MTVDTGMHQASLHGVAATTPQGSKKDAGEFEIVVDAAGSVFDWAYPTGVIEGAASQFIALAGGGMSIRFLISFCTYVFLAGPYGV
jgi:hypothetical protein